MWIAFDIFPAQECLSGTPTTLFAQVENTDNGIGTASSQYLSNSEASYCVFTRVVAGQQGGVNEWYAANTDETILTFYENSGQFATGGGWIEDPNGSKGTFGFNGRYLKKDQAKGHMIYIFRGEYQNEMVDYVIKSNAVNALAFSGDEYPISATLQGKGTIQINRSSDGKLLLDMGNATFIATVIDTDNDDPDMFSITVYDRKGVAFKDVQFTELHGGNVVIHTK
jgi:hypothetical protein